jgi:argininosuccinate lyase
MPQKKNPDMAELTRGKTGRVYGNLVALLTMMKGLPMTYNRDLQEDKERVFDTMDTVRAVVRLNAGMIRHISVNEGAVSEAVSDANLLATDLADYLVNKGVAFREAHHVVGQIVALSEKKKTPLNALALEEYQALHPAFGAEILKVFDLRRAMSARKGVGAPGTRQVKSELRRWRKELARHTD